MNSPTEQCTPVNSLGMTQVQAAFMAALNPPYGRSVTLLQTRGLHAEWFQALGGALLATAQRWGITLRIPQAQARRLLDTWVDAWAVSTEHMQAWMGLLVAAPSVDVARTVIDVLAGEIDASGGLSGTEGLWLGLTPERSAIAYAAWVRPGEAQCWSVGDLQAMAALRGWTLTESTAELVR